MTGGRDTTAIQWVEAKDAAKHPTLYRTDPTTENCLAQDIYDVKVEKFCLRYMKMFETSALDKSYYHRL